jgi:hypothetical protein
MMLTNSSSRLVQQTTADRCIPDGPHDIKLEGAGSRGDSQAILPCRMDFIATH